MVHSRFAVQLARAVRAVRVRRFSSAAAGSPTIVYDPVTHIVSSPFKIDVSPLNFPDYLWRNLSSVESKPAITCGLTGRSYTFGQLYNTSQNFGANLKQNLGLKNGDVVALVLPNLPEFSVAFYGAAAAGLVTTFASPIHTDVELGRHFSTAGARAVVTIPQLQEKVRSAMAKVPGGVGPMIMVAPEGTKLEKDDVSFGEWAAKKAKGAEEMLKKPDPAELVALPFSSGTTGVPKGVMLTHANFVSNLCQIDHPAFLHKFDQGGQTKSLAIIPFFHIYGLNAVLNSGISNGYHVISLPMFEPNSFLEALKKYQPTMLSLVPPLITFLAKSPTVTREHLQNLQMISNGAASCPLSVIQELNSKVEGGQMQYKDGYGLTEVSCAASMTLKTYDKRKEGSVGIVVPKAQLKVVNAEGHALPLGETGELLFRGPNVMQGYWKNPEATNETLIGDGWMRTGDVAYIDSDGYIFLVARLKELIKVKGYQVSPTELEEELRNVEGVADVAVIGVAHKAHGEVPKAFVVKKPAAEVTEQQISEFLKSRVAEYKYLRGGVCFVKEIPRSAAGKIDRKALQSL